MILSRRSLLARALGATAGFRLAGHQLLRAGQEQAEVWPGFLTPADQAARDFYGDPEGKRCFSGRWSRAMAGWTRQAITGKPFTQTNNAHRTNYIDPLVTPIPRTGAKVVPIMWTGFPLRLYSFFDDAQSNPKLSQEQIFELADKGQLYRTDGKVWSISGRAEEGKEAPKRIPQYVCPEIDWDRPYVPYFQAGPRGWQDEYFEWSVRRNPDGSIRRVIFTSEDFEYYFALWDHSPEKVLSIYRELLGDRVQLEDLYLKDSTGRPIRDPITRRYAFDFTNKWNRGPTETSEGGAAMSLTSTASQILDAVINVGGAATVPRRLTAYKAGRTAQALVCCALWGSPNRSAGPLIGTVMNRAIENDLVLTIDSPVGLYIQTPNFDLYETPDYTDASEFWRVTRGRVGDGRAGYDSILQAVFEVPEGKGYTVSDIKVRGKRVRWGSQLVTTIDLAVRALAFPPKDRKPSDKPEECVAFLPQSETQPFIQQLQPWAIVEAGSPVVLPLEVAPGIDLADLAFLLQGATAQTTIEFDVPGVEAQERVFMPSNELPPDLAMVSLPANQRQPQQAILFNLVVDQDAAPGPVKIRMRNPGDEREPHVPWQEGWLRILDRRELEECRR